MSRAARHQQQVSVLRRLLSRPLPRLSMPRQRAAALLLAAALGTLMLPAGAGETRRIPAHEKKLNAVLALIEDGQHDEALAAAEELLKEYPNFRLAHLLYGELLRAQGGDVRPLAPPTNYQRTRLARLEAELKTQLATMETPPSASPSEYVLRVRKADPHLVIVHAATSRLYLVRTDGERMEVESDWYASVGREGLNKREIGDYRTPSGLYFITGEVPRHRMQPVHGPRAFALNYPNPIDRMEGREGYSIWIHGVPSDTLRQPPQSTSGCIVLANPDLFEFAKVLERQRTLMPVIVADKADTLADAERQRLIDNVTQAVERWRLAQERVDHRSLSTLYNGRAPARLVPVSSHGARVTIQDLGLIRYPGRRDVVLATFDEVSDSGGRLTNVTRRQMWRFDARSKTWRIASESVSPRRSFE